jgi:predicted RNA-binding Zn-ribbon protein involved in translation (DUF1610 family)
MRIVLEGIGIFALATFMLVAPAVALLMWRDRRRAKRFVPVCRSCGHAGPRGSKTPDRCPACGENPEQRRVLREFAIAGQADGGQAGRRRAPSDPEEEAIQRVVLARQYEDTEYLIDALRDPEPRVRGGAAYFLGSLEAREATPALVRLLRAGNPSVRSAGANALGMLRAAEIVPDLIELAEGDRELAPRTHAITALGEIGDARAAQTLVLLLRDEEWLVRYCAARALGACGDLSTIEELEHAATREPPRRRGVYRRAVRRIRRRHRRYLRMEWWPLSRKTRRTLWGIAFRALLFGLIFFSLLKWAPGA